ncbi:MAG TPA: hypothetical protein ENI23_12245 [bacterium]|nr:hypothetical protein [bacterium]
MRKPLNKFIYVFVIYSVISFIEVSVEKIVESKVNQINLLIINAQTSNIGFILKSSVHTVVGITSAIKGEIVISVGPPAKESKAFIEIEATTLDKKNESINKK